MDAWLLFQEMRPGFGQGVGVGDSVHGLGDVGARAVQDVGEMRLCYAHMVFSRFLLLLTEGAFNPPWPRP